MFRARLQSSAPVRRAVKANRNRHAPPANAYGVAALGSTLSPNLAASMGTFG